jgi:hypothetical protein
VQWDLSNEAKPVVFVEVYNSVMCDPILSAKVKELIKSIGKM